MVSSSLKKAGFDRLLFRRLRKMIPVMFASCCARSSMLFMFLLILGIVGEVLAYNVGIVPSKFYAVLGKKDKQGFYAVFLEASLYIVGTAVILSSKQYVSSILYLCWRKLLTKHLHRLYFKDKSYYTINVLDTSVDNPDQRITQDVDKMCEKLSVIAPVFLIAPFKIAYYSYLSFIKTTYIGPLSIFAYFVAGTIISKLLMSPVINFVVKQEKREGDLRFKHMQIRSNAESLAFHDCSNLEERRLGFRLYSLLATQLFLANLRLGLNLFLNFYNYFGGILSHLIISIPIFAGVYDDLSPADLAALISANAFVSIYLISSFTSLVDLSSDVTEIAGTAHRVGQLMEKLSPDRKNLDKQAIILHRSDDDENLLPPESDFLYQLTNVTIFPPNELLNSLVTDLSWIVRDTDRVLICGPSSCGKSSLMRVLAGLWPVKGGQVWKNVSHPIQPSEVLFLPQKPYFTDGSLWQQIVFPLETSLHLDDLEEEKVRGCLVRAGCEKIAERVDSVNAKVTWSWYDVLSPGEMQRLVFARLFYHRPRIAFVDEATSAVSLEVEEQLYGECLELGITYVSVGHRASLRRFHQHVLELDGKGGWLLTALESPEKNPD